MGERGYEGVSNMSTESGKRKIGTDERGIAGKYIFLIIVLFILIGATVAAIILYPSKPEMSVEEVRIVDVEYTDNGGPLQPEIELVLQLELDIKIVNDNYFGGDIDGIAGNVYLAERSPGDDDFIGDFNRERSFEVPSQGSVTVTLDFFLRDIPTPAESRRILRDDKAVIRTKGEVSISFGLKDFSVPFDETTEIDGFL